MRSLFAQAALALMLASPVTAFPLNTWGPDLSDLWWDPNESGWGVNVVHQHDMVFMTILVYGPDNRPRWYVADSLRADQAVYRGPLYETTGPAFGGTYDPAAVGNRQVGSVALTVDYADSDVVTLRYSIDGVAFDRTLRRQTFRSRILDGLHLGGWTYGTVSCRPDLFQPGGTRTSEATFQLEQRGSAVDIVASRKEDGVKCTYSGIYTQAGRMGRIEGQATCSTGRRGTFKARDVEVGRMGFFAVYVAAFDDGCTESGWFGGFRY